MKYFLILITVIFIASCEAGNNKTSKYSVKYNGVIKHMMQKGDISAKANLKDFENTEHFYAIGAFENLKGEIQIFDSKPFNSMELTTL